MATIGQSLTSPESGWKRYDNTFNKIIYSGIWTHSTGIATAYQQTESFTNAKGSNAVFYFRGAMIRFVVSTGTNRSKNADIIIDGNVDRYNAYSTTTISQALIYEKINLTNDWHKVELILNDSDYLVIDAIDIAINGDIRLPYNKMILENESRYYSLSDNTLIHLPDNSPKNMILHGIEQGKEIQLDVPFTKHRYFNDTPVVNVSGKVFTHDIGKINTLNIKETTENKSFVTTWYDTKMIDDNTPSPLVASASSVFSTTYSASKAFDLDNATYWTTLANQHLNSWLMIDLGASKDINVVKLTPSSYLNETPITFIIEASDNGNDWTKVLHVVGFKNWIAGVPVIFNMKQTSTRYIRITHKESLALQGDSWYTAWGEVAYGLREVK